MNPRPQWTIYKNDQPIGQAVTWHKALDILMFTCGIIHVEVTRYPGIYIVKEYNKTDNYKIVKER